MTSSADIRRAQVSDATLVAGLALQLWPDNAPEELTDEFVSLLRSPEAAVFLTLDNGEAVGFAQCQLRHDYVEGTSSSPVGYLEGIYVAPAHQRQGRAHALLATCKAWAREMGCAEFASDCALDNTVSQAFHRALGFTEAGRIVCYTARL